LAHCDVELLPLCDGAEFVVGSSEVAPDAGDFDVGLVDEPPHADRVPTWSRRVDQQRREALHSTETG
jgi:hypothetical protein